jgi:glycosyltransferase involved in cell wall biosynthesis
MPTVLHVLPHPGGGAETYIDLLEGLEGYEHQRFPLSLTRSRLAGVPSVLTRWRRLRQLSRGVSLVHVHGDMAAILATPLLRRSSFVRLFRTKDERHGSGSGPALVITTHGLHRLRRSGGLAGRLVRRRLTAAVAASARTICIAADERDDLAAALAPGLRDRLVVVPNGVPLPPDADPNTRVRVRRSLGLREHEVAVLFAGQLEQRKDPLGAASAVEAARENGGELVLLIAGAGQLSNQVQARAGAGVRPLGHREDLDDLYAAADLFLLPSHREGMSFALLEAMAHGLAPVVADGTGNAETVGETGVIFAPGDLTALSQRLAELAADPAVRARLGAAARERIRTELSLERFLAGTREQYEAALTGRPAQGA